MVVSIVKKSNSLGVYYNMNAPAGSLLLFGFAKDAGALELGSDLPRQRAGRLVEQRFIINRQDDIVGPGDIAFDGLDILVQPAADAVPRDSRLFDLAADDHRQAVGGAPLVQKAFDRESAAPGSSPALVYMAEAIVAVKTVGPRNHISSL